MLISELMSRLKDMKAQHGDIPIKVADRKTVLVSVCERSGEEYCMITGHLEDGKKHS